MAFPITLDILGGIIHIFTLKHLLGNSAVLEKKNVKAQVRPGPGKLSWLARLDTPRLRVGSRIRARTRSNQWVGQQIDVFFFLSLSLPLSPSLKLINKKDKSPRDFDGVKKLFCAAPNKCLIQTFGWWHRVLCTVLTSSWSDNAVNYSPG